MKKVGVGIPLASVEKTTVETELAQKFSVFGYPTIKHLVGEKVVQEGFENILTIAKMDGTANVSPIDKISW